MRPASSLAAGHRETALGRVFLVATTVTDAVVASVRLPMMGKRCNSSGHKMETLLCFSYWRRCRKLALVLPTDQELSGI